MAKPAGNSPFQDCGFAIAISFHLSIYVGIALFFYWLMQPTVNQNPGLAAYKPPPKTVVVYADSPWVPPAPSELPPSIAVAGPPSSIAAAEPTPEVVESAVVTPKKETEKRAARKTPRRERPMIRERQNPMWDYAFSPSFGSRPWF
jgi:uncharacterized iron-regulated membrane protein